MQNTDGESGKRIFVKVFGFSDVERHALNTVFRLSESRPVAYALWTADAPKDAELALIDGDSREVALEVANPLHEALQIIWVGASPPGNAMQVFTRPVQWAAVVKGLDQLYISPPAESSKTQSAIGRLDLDLDLEGGLEGPLDFDISSVAALVDIDLDFDLTAQSLDGSDAEVSTAPMPLEPLAAADDRPRGLIVSANLETRLYLRARLSIADLVLVDEVATAAEALRMAATTSYAALVLDKAVADMSCWKLLRTLRQSMTATGNVVLIGRDLSPVDTLRARYMGLAGALRKPLHPARLAFLFSQLTRLRQ